MKVRTRFAPSPTGYLHIGGVRTALYSWLYAKKQHGEFILRIEDTDTERSTHAATDVILQGLQWLGLDYDEGPFFQSQRLSRYREILTQWLKEGKAYRCYCSKERLMELRERQRAKRQKPRYDGYCRNRKSTPPDQTSVIRFCNPLNGEVVVDDKVHGPVIFRNNELDDLIIARSDGSPTYNFTVVVDDSDMHITHVIRGDDHLNNTPRQINLLLALNAPLPVYAHLPMILDSEGKKLSKRTGAANILNYKKEGYLADAVVNYLVKLGWSHGDQEIFSRQEMIYYFDFNHLNKSSASINPDKLIWLNQQYLKTEDINQIVCLFAKKCQALNIPTDKGPDCVDVVTLQRERVKTLNEMAEKSRYFYLAPEIDTKTLSEAMKSILKIILQGFQALSTWTDDSIHHVLLETAETLNLKLGKVAQPLRWVITGQSISPPMSQTLRVLGKKEVCDRIQRVVN